jgi:hypothetical protein
MDILSIVNHYWPDTIAKLALEQQHLPNGVPFMGVYVELFAGKTLPSAVAVQAKQAEYEALQLTNQLKAALAAHRYAVEVGGTTVGGMALNTDRETQAVLTAARTLAKEDAAYSVKWKTASGSFVTLNSVTIIVAANAVAAFVQKCFSSEATVAGNITSYNNVAAVTAAFDQLMGA